MAAFGYAKLSASSALRIPSHEAERSERPVSVMSSRVRLPALRCPFGSEISPHADEVDRHVLDWARSFALLTDQAEIDRFGRAKVGRLAARTSPRSDTDALGDLMDRLTEAASGRQVFRFLSAVRGYLLAQFWEAGHRADDRPSGLAEYKVMRRHSGAVPTCVALIDVVGGFELDTAQFCRRDVRALTDIAVNVTCWANDILSYPKESQRSLKVHSLPAVLAAELHLSPAEAIKVAAAMHDAEVARYLESEPPLRP